MATTFCGNEATRTGYLSDSRKRFRPRANDLHTIKLSPPLTQDCLDALKNKARLVAVIGKLWELKATAREFFDLVNVEFEVDPDAPGEHFLIFNVTASGDIKEIAARRREWHHRTEGFLGRDSNFVRLVIDVK